MMYRFTEKMKYKISRKILYVLCFVFIWISSVFAQDLTVEQRTLLKSQFCNDRQELGFAGYYLNPKIKINKEQSDIENSSWVLQCRYGSYTVEAARKVSANNFESRIERFNVIQVLFINF